MRDCVITAVDVHGRFPTSRSLAGSDAMNEAPDYSAAYVILSTDGELSGHGLTFTIGAGPRSWWPRSMRWRRWSAAGGLSDVAADPRRFWRDVTGDSQLRWLGPEKGVITWPLRRWSTRSGTCGRRPRASRCGSWSST